MQFFFKKMSLNVFLFWMKISNYLCIYMQFCFQQNVLECTLKQNDRISLRILSKKLIFFLTFSKEKSEIVCVFIYNFFSKKCPWVYFKTRWWNFPKNFEKKYDIFLNVFWRKIWKWLYIYMHIFFKKMSLNVFFFFA